MKNNELKDNFIKYFGEEKWNQEEALAVLYKEELKLCNYLGIDPIPVITDTIEEDSRYYIEENYIVISDKLILDKTEALKCLIHELRHCYQFNCVRNNVDNNLVKIWKEEFATAHLIEYGAMTTELDAFAFTKYIMKEWYNINIVFPDIVYDEILTRYINKYFINK